ncbi:MAG: hypothetical protein LBB56_05485 [Chitinispirillales bacterium]|jgi:energy-coupling factor transporter ATP-binding protein EcfA2|nr:hypothetical protein [Chitinispirillales bacterium]
MLNDKYNELFKEIKVLTDSISKSKSRIESVKNRKESEIPARILTLEEQLKKIDDEYMPRIEGFRHMAEKNLDSGNLLTIEAPPGYRVNLNRLRNWAMLIDPTSYNDPYAQRVYLTARCDECFLAKKKIEFTNRIKELTGEADTILETETEEQNAKVKELNEKLNEIAHGLKLSDFAEMVKRENSKYWFETLPEAFNNPIQSNENMAFGAYLAPLGFTEKQSSHIRQLFDKYSSKTGEYVYMPVELQTDKEYAISVICPPALTKKLDRGLQNFILNIINNNPAGSNKIYIIDAVRFNSSVLGGIKQLENTFAVERLPRNPEQVGALLEKIVSNFADIDDLLDLHDSVLEYNEKAEVSKRLPRMTLILFGWSNAFEGKDRDFIQRIMTNYERYGISFINIAFRESKNSAEELPEYAAQNAIKINMHPNETTITLVNGTPQKFSWYPLSGELPESYVESIKAVKIESATKGSEYTKRYNLKEFSPYSREYQPLELPFGVDAKDRAHNMSFERENFAAYLVGASGSGKSTLLHTLIAGVIRNFHPDNVELWLADFKQLEFKKYMKHCPPHIRYILLDESVELVYDLIDRINKKMMERQQVFGRLGKERLDQIDPRDLNEPMPLIFIILDEFSVMSQAISESQVYKLRLQNILAKGRALGIRFLFASQTFTKGIAGLTPTAKDQIQQRISMKGAREEISETLELSANLKTDQVNNWMDALPPYYALVKHRTGADTPPEVKRVNVMWFPDYNERDGMIERSNETMTAVDRYTPNDINTYVKKDPITVDGNTYDAFNTTDFNNHVNKLKNVGSDYSGDEVFISFGTPRLMEKIKTATLSHETRENIIVIARDAEQSCTAAILTSAMKSFISQSGKVRVWAYGKNRVYKSFRNTAWNSENFSDVRFFEGMDDICNEIRSLKNDIKEKKISNEIIILVGIDRICSDFDFIDGDATSAKAVQKKKQQERENQAILSGAVATTDFEKACDEWDENQFTAWMEATNEAREAGKSDEEVKESGENANESFAKENPYPKEEDFIKVSNQIDEPQSTMESSESELSVSGAYNATEDFQYVIKQGSKLGYHFMLCLNSFIDLKTTSLKLDFFRHRMAFQVSVDDSRELFGNRNASALPEHICQYYDTIEGYSFRPYMHDNISWDGWVVENEQAKNPFNI